jgi:dihydroneopterin aldolase
MSPADVLQLPVQHVARERMAPASPPRLRAAPDRIVIRRLAMDARIGVYDWEQTAPQPIVIDLEFTLPDSPASHTDELAHTIDYAQVVGRLREVALGCPRQLVEALAHAMADVLISEFRLSDLRLSLFKLAPFPGAEVGIVIERQA